VVLTVLGEPECLRRPGSARTRHRSGICRRAPGAATHHVAPEGSQTGREEITSQHEACEGSDQHGLRAPVKSELTQDRSGGRTPADGPYAKPSRTTGSLAGWLAVTATAAPTR
jgi:hypothetical protein